MSDCCSEVLHIAGKKQWGALEEGLLALTSSSCAEKMSLAFPGSLPNCWQLTINKLAGLVAGLLKKIKSCLLKVLMLKMCVLLCLLHW